MTADMAKLERVRQFVEDKVILNPRAAGFSVGIGLVEEKGRETGEVGVIVKVEHKVSAQNLSVEESDRWEEICQYADAQGVRVDVQESPVPTDQRLWISDESEVMTAFALPLNVAEHRRCHQCPIPSGVQIAPRGKNWVGTLGCAVRFKDKATGEIRHGSLTNAHVTGFRSVGTEMLQPSQGGDWFGKVARAVDLHFDRKPNLIDAALIDCFRPPDGKYQGKNGGTVKPELIGIGRVNPVAVDPQIGMRVQKSGRTTGVTTGRITEISSSTFVNYGPDGTAYFVEQMVIKADKGEFSAGGDSGSLIVTMDRSPVGLLYAGSPGQTIANYVKKNVMAWGEIAFY